MIFGFSLSSQRAPDPLSHAALMPQLESLVQQVGKEIMLRFKADGFVTQKPDGSPVTEADHIAEAIIVAELRRMAPALPIVAEEAMSAPGARAPDISGGVFWLVDALDGTREFVRQADDFTVNIALIENADPVLGIIHHPVSGVTYIGHKDGGAFRIQPDGTREVIRTAISESAFRIISSKSFGNEIQLAKYLAGRQILEHRYRASSIKFCEVAEGRADLYPRFGPSREWDTAAGHAIVLAAGGSVATSAGQPLLYGKENFVNSDFIARGRKV
jgi:3'(2'), 5'-bisphosphate nucleotidase